MDKLPPEVLAALLIGLISLVWTLLKRADSTQQKQIDDQGSKIDLLFTKHDAMIEAVGKLREEIARDHYQKHELDGRFAELRSSISNDMEKLGAELRTMTSLLRDLTITVKAHVELEDRMRAEQRK